MMSIRTGRCAAHFNTLNECTSVENQTCRHISLANADRIRGCSVIDFTFPIVPSKCCC